MAPIWSSGSVVATCWRPPVVGVVVDPFRAPSCTWCSGQRGLGYRVGADVEVHAATTGTVSFAGTVVGVTYVVVDDAQGWKLTYGQLSSMEVQVGRVVVAGQVIGSTSQSFYFGLRIDGAYADPSPYLGTPKGRPRLVPVDGSPGRPSPPSALRCQVDRGGR